MTDERPTHLDLFSGIGGFALAAQWAGFRTIGFCEIDKYCQKVLAKNFMADTECQSIATANNGREERKQNVRTSIRNFNSSSRPRLFSNIFDFDGTACRGVSLITGGFPCQPFSVAGKRRGAEDDRAIWPQMLRVISEARPAWVLAENVPGIIPMELDNVLSDLEGIGYATRAFVIPACAVDARHRRDRIWIVGYRIEPGLEGHAGNGDRGGQPGRQQTETSRSTSETNLSMADAADADGKDHRRGQREVQLGRSCRTEQGTWLPEPDVGRVAHGIPNRVDRLKGLGNAIVPAVAYELLRPIYQLIMETRCVTIKDESEVSNAIGVEERKESQEKSMADGTKAREET